MAELYGVETKALNQAVKRNTERFPDYFCFQLDKEESLELVSNCDRFNILKHSSSSPYAFTEQGVAMLSAVLRSPKAVQVSIEIMNAFVQMRHYLHNSVGLIGRLKAFETKVETRLVDHELKFKKIDENFSKIFNALDATPQRAKEGVFFKGQIFDAYAFFQDIIKTAKKEIILIDGYVDLSVLERRNPKNRQTANPLRSLKIFIILTNGIFD